MNKVKASIEQKLSAIAHSHLEVINESHMHSVPENSETHFKVVMVSEEFQALPRVHRHRKINEILSDELQGPVHALSLKLYTLEEWQAISPESLESPDCKGGSKRG